MRALGLLATVALAVSACGDGGGDIGDGPDRLPAVTVTPLDGGPGPLDLAGVTGPAVINMWATWCAPCRRELPAFQDASEAHPDVAFIGVDIAEDPVAARAFLDRLGVTFPQYADQDGELSDALGVASLPVTLLVDGRGELTTHLGPMSPDDLSAALATL
ncbi:MAG: TlpA family protein disulfide reductase [Ilumatobacteraceae bacterium]